MVRRRQYFVPPELLDLAGEEYATRQEQLLAACPEATQFTDEEAEDFLAATVYFDVIDYRTIVEGLRRGRIPVPVRTASNPYLVGRHVLSQWQKPDLRQTFFRNAESLAVDFSLLAKLRRRREIGELLHIAGRHLSPALFSVFRRHGLSDVIPVIVAAFSPDLIVRHRALLLHGKVLMHRLLNEPEPERRPSRRKRFNLTRRLRLREVQLHSMRRSVHVLSRERDHLLDLVSSAMGQENPEWEALMAEAKQVRHDLAEAERRYSATMQEEDQKYQPEIAALRAELASLQQDFADTLAQRSAWLSLSRR